MRTTKKARILEYAAGFFLLVYSLLIFFKVRQGDYFYLLLGMVSFALYLLLFAEYRKAVNAPISETPTLPKIDLPVNPMESEKTGREENRNVKQFRQFLQQVADSKHINITFHRASKGGHMDIPELWLMEKPIPLTPNELYELTHYNRVATLRVFPHDDDIIYVHQVYFEDDDRIEYQVSPGYFTALNQAKNPSA